AAGQMLRLRIERARLHLERIDEPGDRLADRAFAEQPSRAMRAQMAHNAVIGDALLAGGSPHVPVFRNMGETGAPHGKRLGVRHGRAAQPNLALIDMAQPRYRLDELGWPVARYARDADDFAGPHAKVDPVQQRPAALTAMNRGPGHVQDGFARLDRALLPADELATDHQPRQLLGIRVA